VVDHPNIAKVLDAGASDSGGPYFVMELVGGIAMQGLYFREGGPPVHCRGLASGLRTT